jgi:hypothetical protein
MKNYILSSAVPLILIFIFCITVISFVEKSEEVTLKEKVSDMVTFVDGEATEVADMIAIDQDWGTYDYTTLLAHAAEYYDKRPMTFAAAYDADFNCVSERYESIKGVPFNPWKYREFTDAIAAAFPSWETRANDIPPYGNLEIEFDPGVEEPRTMYLYFRWIPDDVNNPFLLVAAISEYSVENSVKDTFYFRMIIIAALAAIMTVIASVLQRKAQHEQSTDWNRIRERADE